MTSLNFLFIDHPTLQYYQHVVAILEEKLKEDVKVKLKGNFFFLVVGVAPASIISNFHIPEYANGQPINLIVFDKTLTDYCKFDPHEKAAAIMHELGHKFNYHEGKIEREYYADYFVKEMGMKNHLVSSLKKYISSDLPFAEEKKNEISLRIDKLNSEEIFKGKEKFT